MPEVFGHAQRVVKFRNTLLGYSDKKFFSLMRIYLGEIKTPFSKPKLIESLEAFFRNQENIQALRLFLTEEEIKVVTAAVFIPDCTEDKLKEFFEAEFTEYRLYEILRNLEERFLVYTYENFGTVCYAFNPLLESVLDDLIEIENLIPKVKIEKKEEEKEFVLFDEFLCASVNFISKNPRLVKQDGSLKKHSINILEEVFPGNRERFEFLLKGLLNLRIIKETYKGFETDWKRFEVFARQDILVQYLYIAAAYCEVSGRDAVRKRAQLLSDILNNVAKDGCTVESFMRTGYLIQARPQEVQAAVSKGAGRFAQILSSYHAVSQENQQENWMFNGALAKEFSVLTGLGLLVKKGRAGDGKEIFAPAGIFCRQSIHKESEKEPDLKGMLNLDAGFDFQLMPGFKAKDILVLLKFSEIKKFDTVSRYTIDCQSIMAGFDLKLDSKQIISALNQRTRFVLPEFISIQIEEWQSSYFAASIYKGYILKLDEKVSVLAANNKVISPHIYCQIAPGVFLLDVEDDEQALKLIKESGLDFIGNIKAAQKTPEIAQYLPLDFGGHKIDGRKDFPPAKVPDEPIKPVTAGALKKKLYAALNKRGLEPEIRETLEQWIEHKVILTQTQLEKAAVRIDVLSAGLMDFAGKQYIVELAQKNNERIEIETEGKKVTGLPIKLLNIGTENDAVVVLKDTDSGKDVEEFSLAKAKKIRRIRQSIIEN